MPDWASEVRTRLSSLHLSSTREAEIVDELSQHLDDRYAEVIAGGTSPEEAARVTLAEFRNGNLLAQYLAPLRQAHPPSPVTPGAPTGRAFADLWQDVRYATRKSLKQPGFAAVAVLTLAVGIGATTAIFSVVYSVVLRPLPFHEPNRLVSLLHRAPGVHLSTLNQGPATYFTYIDHQQIFDGLGAWDSGDVSITGRGEPEQAEALFITEGTLRLLRIQPERGRLFESGDDLPGAPLRAVLVHGFWERRFGRSEQVIGQVLDVDGKSAEVIGVLPASFKFMRADPALVLPMQLSRTTAFRGYDFRFQLIGRLKPNTTVPSAAADVARMIPMLPPQYAKLELEPNIRPLAAEIVGDIGHVLWILLAVVGAVLSIACGNVASLFLIRAEGRQHELALRAAFGASRARLARVLLAESTLLAVCGGALGVAMAQGAIGLLRASAPTELPRVSEIALHPQVLLFALAISIASGLLFGLVAVLRFRQPNIATLKEAGRSASDGPGRHRAQNTLVIAQIALALTLLIVSGLMIRTFVALRQVPPGFKDPQTVQTFRLVIPGHLVPEPEEAARTHENIAQRLAQVPGVTAVGISSSLTMEGDRNTHPLFVEGVALEEGALPPLRRFKSFAPNYFETMGNRLVAGRSITWAEIHQRRPVVVISENLAREYWSAPSRALGTRVRSSPNRAWHEIVGVVGDERDDGVHASPTSIVYWPLLNDSYQRQAFAYAVRSTRVGALGFLRELQEAVWSVNPNLPLANQQTLDAIEGASMAQTSFAMVMLGIAASVALLLGVVGIYGVIAYMATQRTREIGIRVALGAQVADVRNLFLRHGLWLTAVGVSLGVGVAFAATQAISALLFGVGPMDPFTYAAVALVLGCAALLAAYLPARRAASTDPIVALRANL